MRTVRHRLAVSLAIIAALCGVFFTPQDGASASSTYNAHIVGTDIGIMFRTTPNDWEARGGPAGYDGDTIALHCAIEGVPVGPYSNRIWYQASGLQGSGYLPDRFLDTPINANEWLPGIPRCDDQNGQSQASSTVFFRPLDIPADMRNLTPAGSNIAYENWAAGNCSDALAASTVPSDATTLAGWSLGRLGIVYFLNTASQERINKVRTIVLFDPGESKEFAEPSLFDKARGRKTCDWKYDINGMLTRWLSSNDSNRLIVLTGHVTEEKKDGRSTFAGLWKYYLAGIWNQPFAGRAQVCDYDNMTHNEVMRNFAFVVKSPPNGCPSGSGLTAWHP